MDRSEAAQVGVTDGADGLVAGLRRHDSKAHDELCTRYGRRVHRYLVNRLHGDADLAEDLLVQTMAEAARNIVRFDARKATFTAWVFGIARRQVQLELRRQSRRKSVPLSAQAPLEAAAEVSTGDMAEALAERMQAQRQVAILRGCLSSVEMEALVLQYVHQLSIAEIGQVMGRSGRAIESLLHRARTKARERLVKDV